MTSISVETRQEFNVATRDYSALCELRRLLGEALATGDYRDPDTARAVLSRCIAITEARITDA